jgi:RNA polymerase sigma-32 factor
MGHMIANARFESSSPYFRALRATPMLSPETEQALAYRWRDRHDTAAGHQLVASHLRLVVKIAKGYRGYGLPLDDLIGEGHVGLMRSLCRFDPDRGARFATYAIWWVHAAIREYVLNNWSLVKVGTTPARKKLFFSLRRLRGQLQALDDGALKPEHVTKIATMLNVPEHEVTSMNERMTGPDHSLNAPGIDGQGEWQTSLADDTESQEASLAEREEAAQRKSLLMSGLKDLSQRERHIVIERHLQENPLPLRSLSEQFGISNERVRQIEASALSKLRRHLARTPAAAF